MILLAIDSSGTTASAALMDNYIVLAEASTYCKTHSETLLPMIDQLFTLSSRLPEEVDCIACTCGPGSFTGLRIGAATAKGLAQGLGKALIAVPTLDAMAYTVNTAATDWVVPMMDARRGHVYAAIYQGTKRLSEYMAAPVEDVIARLKGQMSKGDNVHIIGNGLSNWRLRASAVGAAAIGMGMQGTSESEFSLLYIRKPQAEREKEERENKCLPSLT